MEENLYTSNSDLKGKIIFLLKIILFIILLLPFIYKLGNKYKTASTENLINGYNQGRWEEFYSLRENSLDMVFLGSSHSYCTFDPEIIDKIVGSSSYQLGMPLQHYDSTYYTLLEVLNYHKPKRVVVEVYWDMLDDDFELKQATMLFQVLKNDALEQDYINKVFPMGEKIKYNNNVFKYQADYFAYETKQWQEKIQNKFGVALKASERQQGVEKYRSRGYTYCDYKMLSSELDKTNQFKNFDGKDWKASDVQKGWLKKLVDKCNENDIEVIFVTAPIANVSMEYIKNYDIVHNYIQKMADEWDIKYYDYNIINKNKNLLSLDNFRDDAHLNHSGVEIISKDFAENVLVD